jgi:MFS family permease
VSRLLELLLPGRLGHDVRWLFAGVAGTNLADGVLLAAAPLLVATLTRDPFAVSMALFAQRLPWLLFGLPAGAQVDRSDRRRLVVSVNAVRGVVLALLALLLVSDLLSLPVLYAVLFLLGSAEVLGDNAGVALLADVTPPTDLGLANSRLTGAHQVANQLAGPAVGAGLFALASVAPFGVAAALYVVGALAVVRLHPRPPVAPRPRALRREVGEGIAWLRGNAAVRRLVVLITLFNLSFGMAYSIWVLYALERLGLGEAGFGLLLSASAVGGVVGAGVYERLERRFGDATLLRTGLVLETLHHAGLALTTTPVVAGLVLFAFGLHGAVWGSLSRTIRLRATPTELQGRVGSINMIGVFGTLVVGAAVGGLLARQVGVVGVLWTTFGLAAATTVWSWRSIGEISGAGVASRDAVLPSDGQSGVAPH